jgi:hypothetical protein
MGLKNAFDYENESPSVRDRWRCRYHRQMSKFGTLSNKNSLSIFQQKKRCSAVLKEE